MNVDISECIMNVGEPEGIEWTDSQVLFGVEESVGRSDEGDTAAARRTHRATGARALWAPAGESGWDTNT